MVTNIKIIKILIEFSCLLDFCEKNDNVNFFINFKVHTRHNYIIFVFWRKMNVCGIRVEGKNNLSLKLFVCIITSAILSSLEHEVQTPIKIYFK